MNQTEIAIVLTAKDKLSAALNRVQKNTKSTYSELKSLQRLKAININVDPKHELELTKRNLRNLKDQIISLNAKKIDIVKSGDSAKISQINSQINNLTASAHAAQMQLNKLKLSSQLGQSLQRVGGTMTKLGQSTRTLSRTAQVGLLAAAKVTFDYEKGVARLGTISNLSAKENSKLSKEVARTAAAMGADPVEALEAAYQGYSASLIKSSKDAKPVISTMTKLAKVGGTEVTSAMDLVSSTLNAYGLKAKDATKVSDIFINTQNKGKTTIDELAQSFGQVGPIASAMKVDLKQLSAGYITLTKQGNKTAEATTQLKAVFSSLMAPNEALKGAIDKTGISFKEFEAKGGTLPEYLKKLKEAVGGSDTEFINLFSNLRAKQGVTGLSFKNFSDLDQAMKDAGASSGTLNETFNKFSATPAQRLQVAFDKLKESLIEIGEKALPVVGKIADKISAMSPESLVTIVGAFTSLSLLSPGLTLAGTALTTIGGAILLMTGSIAEASAGATVLAAVLGAAFSPIGLIIGGITLVIGAAVLAWNTNFLGFRDFMISLWEGIKFVAMATWTSISESVIAIWENIKIIWTGAGEFFSALWENIKTITMTVWTTISDTISSIWESIKAIWTGAGDFFNTLWTTISSAVVPLLQPLGDAFSAIWETIKAMWNNLINVFSGVINGILLVVKPIVALIGGVFRLAWTIVTGIWLVAKSFFFGVISAVMSVFKPIGKFIGDLFQFAWKFVQNVWLGAKLFFFGIINGIMIIFKPIAKFIWGLFKSAWTFVQNVWQGAKTFFFGIIHAIMSVFNPIANFIGRLFSSAWRFVSGVWSKVSSWFGRIVSGIFRVFSSLPSTISRYFRNAWNFMASAWGKVGSWFSTKVSGIYHVFSGFPAAITKFFADAANGAKDWFEWLADWVGKVPQRIVNAFANLGSSLFNTIKGAIGGAIRAIPGIGGAAAKFLGLARGGWANENQIYRVNEQGQESVTDKFGNTRMLQGSHAVFNKGDKVNTAGKTRNKMKQEAKSQSINITINVTKANANANDIAKQVQKALRSI